ncbi:MULTISPECIES: hypothetical protein [unclassified Thioalkalivibrio]|uniref:hypothetical protein n=1 Tax=unclassified Thioalkalivibrio TaxID=2621013 RepID=UPI001E342FAC|nr:MULTISPECIES: hypothetical protein [unclassified Thioalkalivibrio]
MTDEDRRYIATELEQRGIQIGDPAAFFNALTEGIRTFLSGDKLRQEVLPGTVRENLAATVDTAEILLDQLNNLDDLSRYLLDTKSDDGLLSMQSAHAALLGALYGARDTAAQYPRKGDLPKDHRTFFARDIADAIQVHLGVRPTTTKGGLYETILSIALELATGQPVQDAHALARKGLKVQKDVSQGGLIVHTPPKAK